MENKSLGGARYFATFIDNYTKMCFIYFLNAKDEIFQMFRRFKVFEEKQHKIQTIKILRTDNGGEYWYYIKEFEGFFKNGIVHQKNNFLPEQNSIAECFNQIVVEKAKYLMFHENVDKFLWAQSYNTACYLKNIFTAAGISKTPFESWTNKKPELGQLRIYGIEIKVHIPKVNRQKWDQKATKHILFGDDENIKGYRCYNPIIKNVLLLVEMSQFLKRIGKHMYESLD